MVHGSKGKVDRWQHIRASPHTLRPSAQLNISEKRARQLLQPRYDVLGFVGAGVSAAVYKVADKAAEREIRAVKITSLVSPHQEGDPLDALREEFRLASRFDHPNLVRYFDLDILPDHKFALVTMEFVEGESLSPGFVCGDVDKACELVIQVLRGVQFLHESGYIHGDIKPSNILCQSFGERFSAKLLDYHLAFRPLETTSKASRGTLRYMAPEMITQEKADMRSDLYSVGVVFYEALAGIPLFDGSPTDIAVQHLVAPVAELAVAGGARADQLALVLNRLLAKHPEARYTTAGEAISAIGEAMGRQQPPETKETLLGRTRSVPLIGRAEEMARFQGFLSLPPASQPAPRVFLIRGRAGQGKTRLLRECGVWAQSLGFATFRLPSNAGGKEMLSKVEQVLVTPSSTAMKSSEGERDKETSNSRPEKSAMSADDVPRERSALSPGLLAGLDQVADRLLRVCAKRKVAFFVDDLNSIGPTALESLSFLMRALAREPAFYCFTLPEEDVAEGPLKEWLSGWAGDESVQKTVLPELDLNARRDLASRMLPASTPARVVDAIMRSCAGSPGIITATLSHLLATRSITVDANGHVVLTVDLGSAAPESLRRLGSFVAESADPTVRHALELLAVAGDEVELAALADAVGVESGALRAAVEKGPGAGIVSFRATERGVLCRFQHLSFETDLRKSMSEGRLRSLHDQFAETLERRFATDTGEVGIRIASHILQGRSPQKGVERALQVLQATHYVDEGSLKLTQLALRHARGFAREQLLEMAGDMSMARGAFGQAVRYFQEHLESSHTSREARARVLRKLASAHSAAGDYAEARARVERALALQQPDGPSCLSESARAKLVLANVYLYESQFDLAQENYVQVVDAARELGDRQLAAEGLRWLGDTHLRIGAIDEACHAFLRSFWEDGKKRDAVGAGAALAGLGRVAMLKLKWRCGANLLQRALGILRKAGCLSEAARTLSNLGVIHHKLCEWERARVYYEQALDLYDRLGDRRGRSGVLVNLSYVNSLRGALESAIAQAEEALRSAPDEPQLRCYIMRRIAYTKYNLGDLDAAEQMALRALDLATSSNLTDSIESAHRTLGEIETPRGAFPSAQKHLEHALALSRQSGLKDMEAVCLARLAELAAARGDLASALSLAKEACSKAEVLPFDTVKVVAQTVRGKVALVRNELRDAITHLHRAETVLSATRIWDEVVDVDLHLGKAHAAMGQLRFATFYFRTAVDMVEQVAGQLRSERNRRLFLSDPRRVALFDAIRLLRRKLKCRRSISLSRAAVL